VISSLAISMDVSSESDCGEAGRGGDGVGGRNWGEWWGDASEEEGLASKENPTPFFGLGVPVGVPACGNSLISVYANLMVVVRGFVDLMVA
jgi:hypothetical protein